MENNIEFSVAGYQYSSAVYSKLSLDPKSLISIDKKRVQMEVTNAADIRQKEIDLDFREVSENPLVRTWGRLRNVLWGYSDLSKHIEPKKIDQIYYELKYRNENGDTVNLYLTNSEDILLNCYMIRDDSFHLNKLIPQFSSRESWDEYHSTFNVLSKYIVKHSEFLGSTRINECSLEDLVIKFEKAIHYFSDNEVRKRIGIMRGKQGEESVGYVLEWLAEKYVTLSDFTLEHEDVKQQIDFLVVGENGIFNIEVKTLSGELNIDSSGQWIRIKNGIRSGMHSPMFQLERHRKLIKNIIGKNYPIIDVLVLANDYTILKGAQYSKVPIVRRDALTRFIEEYKIANPIDPNFQKEIVDRINESMIENANNRVKIS